MIKVPPPGRAFVMMREQYYDYEDAVTLSENARMRSSLGRVGVIMAVSRYPEGQDSWVYEEGFKVPKQAWRENNKYNSLLGKWVLVRNAKMLWDRLYVVRLEFIECEVPEECVPECSEVSRCKRCPSTGEANILIGPDGYCPVCGYDASDRHITQKEMSASEVEIDHMLRNPAELHHIMTTGGRALTGRIISYPGQINRSKLKQAEKSALREYLRRK